MRIYLGALTMVRAGARKTLTPTVIRPPTNGIRVAPSVPRAPVVTKPVTPTLPQLAPGTIMMLDSQTGAGQDPGVSYETQEASAGGAPFMTINKTAAQPEKSGGVLLPLAAIAAYFLLG